MVCRFCLWWGKLLRLASALRAEAAAVLLVPPAARVSPRDDSGGQPPTLYARARPGLWGVGRCCFVVGLFGCFVLLYERRW